MVGFIREIGKMIKEMGTENYNYPMEIFLRGTTWMERELDMVKI